MASGAKPGPVAAGCSDEGALAPPLAEKVISILLVEDDEFSLEALSAHLEIISRSSQAYGLPPLPIQVYRATTGEDAWDLLRAHQIDIALVDIQLPGITGLDLSWCYSTSVAAEHNQLSSSVESSNHSQQTSTTMIACTSDIDSAQLYAYGMLDVLRKPVRLKALRHMLHKWIPRVVDCTGLGLGAVAASLPREGSSGFFSQRILLVEGCEVTCLAVQTLFQEMGLWLDTAESGEEAVALLSNEESQRHYDLVLMEVALPEMSGYALCSWYKECCRERGRRPALVVAVTSDPDLHTCKEFGIDHCLPKPLTAQMCSHVLHRWMSIRRSAAEAEAAVYGSESMDTSIDGLDMVEVGISGDYDLTAEGLPAEDARNCSPPGRDPVPASR